MYLLAAVILTSGFGGSSPPQANPSRPTGPKSFLATLQRDNIAEFIYGRDFKGAPLSFFARSYSGKATFAKVDAAAKPLFDPQLWDHWSGMPPKPAPGSDVRPSGSSDWMGREGSIYEGWYIQICGNWAADDPKRRENPSDTLGLLLGENLFRFKISGIRYLLDTKGPTGQREVRKPWSEWIDVWITVDCKREDVPRLRETFRHLFGVP